jgi:sulfur carrier protein
MIKINGQDVDIDSIGLMEYLNENGYRVDIIAVECNEEMVPKTEYASWVLHSGDVVEIVSFMGGGC